MDQRLKIILIDDEPAVLKGLKGLINWDDLGYFSPLTASNGLEAEEIITKEYPDVILTDINMPEKDGIELIKSVRSMEHYNPEIVVLSGHDEFEYARQAMSYGVKNYLLKPYDEETFIPVFEDIYAKTMVHKKDEEEEEKSHYIVKQAILRKVLHSEMDKDCISYYLEKLKFSPDYIYHITLGRCSEQEVDEEGIEHLESFLKKDVVDYGESVVIKLDKIRFIIIVIEYKESSFSMKKLLEDLISNRNIPDSRFFITGHKHSLQELSLAYKEIQKAEMFRLFAKDQQLIFYNRIKDKLPSDNSIPLILVRNIISSMEKNELNNLNSSIGDFFNYIKEHLITREIINSHLNYLYLEISRILQNLGEEIPDFLQVTKILQLTDHNSIEELKELISELCHKSQIIISNRRESKSRGIVHDVEEYIKHHYKEDLTIKSIAREFLMNPVYLGRRFKDKLGVSCSGYIHKLRIDAAKKIMSENPELKNSIVAERVGYNNNDYFITKFSSITGMKPSEFRHSLYEK